MDTVLTEQQLVELRVVFDKLDTKRAGVISPADFGQLARAWGDKVTDWDIRDLVSAIG
jgi:Ca2+-binding EF-hand superfamily protein